MACSWARLPPKTRCVWQSIRPGVTHVPPSGTTSFARNPARSVRLPMRTILPSRMPIAALVRIPNGSSAVATMVATWQAVRRRSHMGGALSGSGASVKAMTSSWPNLSDLLADQRDAPVGLVGAPLGVGSVTPGGCDRAPGLLRATLKRIGRSDIDTGRELSSRIADHGDVAIEGLTIEDGLPGGNIAQIGLAPFANSAAMHRDAVAAGNCIVTQAEIARDGIAAAVERALGHVARCDAIFVDCDIDVIDRSQLPGAPGARPGGMAVSDFFAATRMLAGNPKVRVVDLTEWDPTLDATDLSALTAARWVAEVLAGF